MALHSTAKPVNIAMRVLQFIWALLIMALVGNMIADAYGGNPSVVNYTMFVAVFGMLTLFYLIPATIIDAWVIHPLIPVILDALNVVFWFCGGVAMAAELHARSCTNRFYITTNFITDGAYDKQKRCREAQANTAFLWFGFAAFLVSCVLSGLNTSGSASVRPGIRRGPAMSQV